MRSVLPLVAAPLWAMASRFWELVGTNAEVADFVALREALRVYEGAQSTAKSGRVPHRS